VAPVTEVEGESAAMDLELLLAPHRASTEGRVALKSLQCDRPATARTTFQQLIQQHPSDAAYQIGLADACVMQFEASRTDLTPDAEALKLADSHARHACRLDPESADCVGHPRGGAGTYRPPDGCLGRARARGSA